MESNINPQTETKSLVAPTLNQSKEVVMLVGTVALFCLGVLYVHLGSDKDFGVSLGIFTMITLGANFYVPGFLALVCAKYWYSKVRSLQNVTSFTKNITWFSLTLSVITSLFFVLPVLFFIFEIVFE